MFNQFQNLSPMEQYQTIYSLIKQIELECIELSDRINGGADIEKYKLVESPINRLNQFPYSVNFTLDLIKMSKLSKELKMILVDDIKQKIKIITRNKTRK